MKNTSNKTSEKGKFSMKIWSDTVHDDFCLRFFLDTNLLIYLIDNTYQSLTDLIELINDSEFAQLVSSKYVILEFVGARKREHYYRIAAKNSMEKSGTSEINFSSLIKYKDSFKNPDAVFEDEIEGIRNEVLSEVDRIAIDFGIEYEYSSLHADLLQPTLDVCLSSKIASQDSLVLVTSALPQPQQTNSVVMLTNDNSFYQSYNDSNVSALLNETHSIEPPRILRLNSNQYNVIAIGDNAISREEMKKRLTSMIIDLMKNKLASYYLGKTITPNNDGFPKGCIALKIEPGKTLNQENYLIIIGEKLDYFYTTKKPINFWHNNNPINDGFEATAGNNKLTFMIDIFESIEDENVGQEMLTEINTTGNLVFIHPDSIS